VRHYDAIVVGAGPSGAMTAHELGCHGVRTLLIEKHCLPRDKACGGGLTAKVLDILPFSIQSIIERTISTIDLSWRLSVSTALHAARPLAYMVRRRLFDEFLTRKALASGSVTLADGVEVLGIEAAGAGFRVRTAREVFAADHLVGADGAGGLVARALGLMHDRHLIPALENELAVRPDTAERWQDRLGLDLGSLHGSYGWVFPKGDHLNVGAGSFTDRTAVVRALRQYANRHLDRRVEGPYRVISQRGFVLPLRQMGAPIQRGRALLVGDAAGLVDGFTGEGIYWALRSARIAAQSLIDACAGNREAADYQACIDRELMPDLYAARRWAHVYLWWPRGCYVLAQRSPAVWRAVQKLLRGERGFAQLKNRLGAFGFLAELLPARLD
jgi:geranylgeranyl reductase family protein